MVPRDAAPRVTLREIAEAEGRPLATVDKWRRDPSWPEPAGKRGRWLEYDQDAVRKWLTARRRTADLEPARLYTVNQIAEAVEGLTAGTILSYVARGQWPAPDEDKHGVKRWRGSTVTAHRTARRPYRRRSAARTEGDET
jgi:hypothetical protein